MASELFTWVTSRPEKLAYAGASLVAAGLIAAAMRWNQSKPLKALRWHPDGLTRPLSYMDEWYSMHNVAHVQPNFYITALLTGKPWTVAQAEILLSKVIRHHAPSMCTIVDKDDPAKAPYWRRLWHTSYADDEQGIMDIHVEARASDAEDDVSWRHWAQVHEAAGFSVSRPRHSPFRLIIVTKEGCPHFEVIYIPHHALCDGRGATYFVRQLLEEYANCEAEGWDSVRAVDLRVIKMVDTPLVAGKKEKDVDVAEKLAKREEPWQAELEAHINTKPSLWFMLKVVLADKFAFLRPKANAWLGPEDRGIILRPTPTLLWAKVPAALVNELRSICRSRKTTVNGALWSAILFALLRTHRRTLRASSEPQTGHNPQSKDGEVHFNLGNPVDMRSRLNVPNSHLSPLISGVEFHASASNVSQFWQKAIEIPQLITSLIPVGLATHGLIPFIRKPHVPWVFEREARTPNGRRDTLKISNLGCVDYEAKYGSLICRDVWFGRHTVRDGCIFTFFTLTPGQGRDMNIAITAPSELHYGPEAIDFFINTVLEVLNKAVENAKAGEKDFTYADIYQGE